jgi:hypothetical protein
MSPKEHTWALSLVSVMKEIGLSMISEPPTSDIGLNRVEFYIIYVGYRIENSFPDPIFNITWE